MKPIPPRIGITTGDPAGIGPEVSLRAAHDSDLRSLCRMFLFGDAEILRSCAKGLGLSFEFEVVAAKELHRGDPLPENTVVHVPAGDIERGRGSVASGDAAARNILECARACIEGRVEGMATAPLSKRFLIEAGYPFPGHTEYLAHLAHVSSVAMSFLTDRLKVVLVTIHLPLRDAIEKITAQLVFEKLEITIKEFRNLGLPCKRLAVAGVNPHAGESGHLGTEEVEHLDPALREARRLHPDVLIEGPVPADTVFRRAAQGEFDVVLAQFHDQGLAPIKLLGFGEAVNVTLGLPFVRTSVDHGTAFDIAGKGLAHPESMKAAIRWAVRLILSCGTFECGKP